MNRLETFNFFVSSVEIFPTEFLYCCQQFINVHQLTGSLLTTQGVISGAGLRLLPGEAVEGLARQCEEDGEIPHDWSRSDCVVEVLGELSEVELRWSMTARIVLVSVPLPHGTLLPAPGYSRLDSARHTHRVQRQQRHTATTS